MLGQSPDALDSPDRVSSAAARDPPATQIPSDPVKFPGFPGSGVIGCSTRPSQSAPQSTPDHLDLPRVQKQLFWGVFFNNIRFRRGETVVWDNPVIPMIPRIPRIGCH